MTLPGRRTLHTLLVVGLALLGSNERASAQAACDRACLRTMLDQYLQAVIKHDPKAAPLIVGFRQTENAVNVAPGNGVWKTVTGLGKSLGIVTTAEGVETDAQFDLLRREGCTQAQGYLFSPPRPAAEVETMLRRARAAQAVA